MEEPGVYVISGAHLQDSVVDRLEVKGNDKNSGKDVNKKSGPTEVEQSWSNQSGMDSLPDPHEGGHCGHDPGRIDKGTIEFCSSRVTKAIKEGEECKSALHVAIEYDTSGSDHLISPDFVRRKKRVEASSSVTQHR